MKGFKIYIIVIIIGVLLSGLTGCNRSMKEETSLKATATNMLVEDESKVSLNELNINLPSDWTKSGNENEMFFHDKSKQTVGGVSLLGYYGNYFDILPNHSRIISSEDIDISLGQGKLFSLERSSPAASHNPKTWNEVHAIIPINKSNLAYDIWIEGTKDTLFSILKGINKKS